MTLEERKEIRAMVTDYFLSMTEQERFLTGIKLTDWVRLLRAIRIKQKNPELSDVEVKIELFKHYDQKDFTPEQMEDICNWFRSGG